jgi:hypothetical protein
MNNHTPPANSSPRLRPFRFAGETYLILFYQILIDTLAIRNARKHVAINNINFSNRHFYHPLHAPSCHTSSRFPHATPSQILSVIPASLTILPSQIPPSGNMTP